ncbi:DNA polymerase I, partial [candidate division WOR-3 bacterium]|nr:DNA polymerase I [candidate division WOR-3 bacterium]
AELLSLEREKVGPSERNIAKTVNFGVLYGMSPFKLSKDMNIPLKQARDFIESYFQRFSKIKNWQESLVQEAEKSGEIRTFTGRRRKINGLMSKNQKERDRARRKVFNTPVQGGAADIIKIAMVEMDCLLKENGAELVLQIHDELLFEVDEKKVEKTADMVQNAMENAVKLDVPLTVSVDWGDNWFDIH